MTIDSQALDGLIDDCGRVAARHGLDSLGRVASQLRRATDDRRLRVAFIGEFSSGKSQVVNSLLGGEYLPTAATPGARLVTEVSYSPNTAVTLITTQDAEEPVSPEAFRDLAAMNGYRRARVLAPVEWLRDFVLIDTPGLGEPGDISSNVVFAELPHADVIVFVLRAQAALKRSERRFLMEQLRQADRGRVIFLLNQIDHVSAEEVASLEEYVRSQLDSLLPNAALLRYSALEALRARLADDAPGLERANYPAVYNAIVRDLAGDHARLQQANRLANLHASLEAEAEELGARQQTLRMTLDELTATLDRLNHEKARFEERLDRVCSHAGNHLDLIAQHLETQLQSLRLKVEQELPALVGEADPRDLRKHLPFYLESLIQGYLDWQEPALTSRLGELYSEIDRELSHAVIETAGPFQPGTGYIASALRTRPAVYDRGTQTSRFLGIGGVVAVLLMEFPIAAAMLVGSQALRVAFKKQREAAERAQMLDAGKRAMNACLERAREELARQMTGYRERVLAAIRAEGESRLAPVIRSLEQALAARQSSEAERDGPARGWEAAAAEVARLLAQVERYEHSLRGVVGPG